MQITNFIILNLYLLSCFISPTLRSIFLVSGLIIWLILVLKNYFTKNKDGIKLYFSYSSLPYLKIINIVFLLYIVFEFIHGCIHAQNFNHAFMHWIKSFTVTYLQWFWISSNLIFYKSKTSKIFNTLEIPRNCILLFTLVLGALLNSVYILLQILNIFPLHKNGTLGILSQAFTSSGLLIASIFAVLYLLEILTEKYKSILWAVFLVLILTILALSQISSILALIFALIFYFAKSKIFTWKSLLISALIFLTSSLVLYQLSPRLQRKLGRLSSIETLLNNKSVNCRLQLWTNNFNELGSNLFFGQEKENYICKIKNKEIKFDHVHNVYLQKLFTGGLFKFLTWFTFYLFIALFLIRALPLSLPSLSFFLALSFEALLENWWTDSEVLTVFFVMVLWVIARKHEVLTRQSNSTFS